MTVRARKKFSEAVRPLEAICTAASSDYPTEGALCGGHIPGAKSIPWARAVNPDTHTFRPASELRTTVASR